MRLRSDRVGHWLGAIALALIVTAPTAAASGQPPTRAAEDRPTAAEIARALEAVKADPNIATERTIKTLQWRRPDQARSNRFGWMMWLAEFFAWVAQSTRLLVWVAAILLACLLVVYILRLVRARGLPVREPGFAAPTHVRDLDIRPEVLPPDIGAAARRHWDAGERRAALALLYRGLLSRLIHRHRVPIRDSSTEGDCLTLASACLDAGSREYTTHLVKVWQRFVYGGEDVDARVVYALCDGFSSALEAGPDRAGGRDAI